MSKYDQLDYLTFSERNNGPIPKCAEYKDGEQISIPDELIGTTIDEYKKCLNLKNEDEKGFSFVNNNQTIINEHYFDNGHFFSDNMEPDEKKEFLLDYLNYYFGNDIDGKYFKDNLQDIFNLQNYELLAEDFSLMIEEYFKKKKIDINNDPEDRKKFKQIIFPESIKFLNEEEANNYKKKRDDELKKENLDIIHDDSYGNMPNNSEINNSSNNNIKNSNYD